MEKYVLLVDSEPKALALMETALRYFYDGKILQAQSCDEGLSVLKSSGQPDLILVDYDLLIQSKQLKKFLQDDKELYAPVLATSLTNISRFEAAKNFSLIAAVINKPLDAKEFSYTVKSFTTVPHVSPAFVPLSFQTLLNLPRVNVDIFISLSETNFVKVTKKDDRFTKEDADKLQEKGFKEVFIKASSCFELLEAITLNLEELSPKLGPVDQSMVAMNSIENLDNITKFFGWTPEIVEAAKRQVQAAVKILSENDSLIKTLNAKLADKNSTLYSNHVGLISFLSCTLGNQFEWLGESGKTKLILAALMHDYSLDPQTYEYFKKHPEKLESDPKSADVLKYKAHPIDSSNAVKLLESFSSDVEQIILQHHERPDGSGFPRSLTATRISHLSSLFILLEDLVDFLGDGHYIEMSLEGFITDGKEKYTQGSFKKSFEIMDKFLTAKLESKSSN